MAETQDVTTEENIPVASNPSVSYIGEEELKYFLSLVNRLGDLKYMPIDKVIDKAQSAIEANRLSKAVLINGQVFDGTQSISFDEYAKAADVLNKTDCAIAGAEDNSNKVVTLNDKGKVNGDFIDYEHIVKQINEAPFEEIEGKIQAFEEQYQKDFQSLTAAEKNQNTDIATIKSYVGLKQAKVHVDKAPAKVNIEDVEYESYCTPPIEVLKDASEVKTTSLDYVKLGYRGEQGADFTIKNNSIDVKPVLVKKSLLIRDNHPEVDLSNYKDHPDALQKSLVFNIDGKDNYVLATSPIDVSALSSLAELSLAQPSDKFYCAAFVNNKVLYRINDGALEKCYDTADQDVVSDSDAEVNAAQATLIAAVKEAKKGTPNVMLTVDMLRTLESGNVKIIFCTEQEFKPDCPDMTISDLPAEGFFFDADVLLSSQVSRIDSIAPLVTCKNSSIRFGIKKSEDETYAVWDSVAGDWKTVASTKEIGTEGALVEDLAKIPVDSLNIEDMNYTLVFAFIPKAMDATCTLNAITISCIDAAFYEKAVHDTDYNYSLGRNVIAMTFKSTGDYLINYPATDVLPLYDRTITELNPE